MARAFVKWRGWRWELMDDNQEHKVRPMVLFPAPHGKFLARRTVNYNMTFPFTGQPLPGNFSGAAVSEELCNFRVVSSREAPVVRWPYSA